MDMDSIVARPLHDVIEDCNITPEQIEQDFGNTIAQIVVGLTKISKIKFKTKQRIPGRELSQDGHCHGKRYQSYYRKTCRSHA